MIWDGPGHLPELPGEYSPVLRPEVGSYVANAEATRNLTYRFLDTEAYKTQNSNFEMWGFQRGESSHFKVLKAVKAKTFSSVTRLGAARTQTSGPNKYSLGITGAWLYSRDRSVSADTSYHSKGKVYGGSVGVYGTWQNHWDDPEHVASFSQVRLQYAFLSNQVKGDQLSKEKYRTKGFIFQWENGMRLPLDRKGDWVLIPQIEYTYNGVHSRNDHLEASGTSVKVHSGGSAVALRTRLQWKVPKKALSVYGEPEVILRSRKQKVVFDDVPLSSDGSKKEYRMRFGIQGSPADNLRVACEAFAGTSGNGKNNYGAQIKLDWKF